MHHSILTMGALVLISCGPMANTACPDAGTALTYDNFGADFMTGYCVSCHGVGRTEKNVALNTRALVLTWKSQVSSQAGQGTSMPPTGSTIPTQAERDQLVQWVSCGAP